MELLLTAFVGTAAEELGKGIEGCTVLLLPNDKKADGVLLRGELVRKRYDIVLALGQKPRIRDRIFLETEAGSRGKRLQTTADVEELKKVLEKAGFVVCLSRSPGTSFCNALYWAGLEYIKENRLPIGMAFLHVPFLEGITDLPRFGEEFLSAVQEIRRMERRM